MNLNTLYTKAINLEPLSADEGAFLFRNSPPAELFETAQKVRFRHVPENRVSWQIDRNINYTNVCISGCLFCNFHCTVSQKDKSYTTSTEEYRVKIAELRALGGDQILLQGGLHPNYDITFYENLFTELKSIDPEIKLNALGPPEVAHIARISKISIEETLERLVKAGLTTLPGAGAEILSDRIRKIISPAKPNTAKWCEVMRAAQKMGLSTTATMVYGHIESIEERMEHMVTIRDIQADKPAEAPGFRAFISWPMQMEGTKLAEICAKRDITPVEHLKMIAISRIMLTNIPHIQASWLTVGETIGQIALHCGADDMGSIMIEENVVSSAGANYRMGSEEMQRRIREAGFEPWLRGQDYRPR